jgi:hypothetical protein
VISDQSYGLVFERSLSEKTQLWTHVFYQPKADFIGHHSNATGPIASIDATILNDTELAAGADRLFFLNKNKTWAFAIGAGLGLMRRELSTTFHPGRCYAGGALCLVDLGRQTGHDFSIDWALEALFRVGLRVCRIKTFGLLGDLNVSAQGIGLRLPDMKPTSTPDGGPHYIYLPRPGRLMVESTIRF